MNRAYVSGIVVAAVVLAVVAAYVAILRKKREGYVPVQHEATVNVSEGAYELVAPPPTAEGGPESYTYDKDDTTQPAKAKNIAPAHLQGSDLLPQNSRYVTPYNIDVADKNVYSFAVNAPRFTIKNRLYEQADPIRGDIPIVYHPEVAMVGRPTYGRDSQRLDGFMSDHYRDLQQGKAGRAYQNTPVKVADQGTVMDF